VQAFMDQHVARWLDEAKDSRTAHAITAAAPTYNAIQSCVTILHLTASVTSVQQRTSRQLPCPLQESLCKDETRPREPAGSAQHPWETGVLDIAHCHSELAVRWRAGWLGQHSRVFAGSVHSQLAMSRTPVSQGWIAATIAEVQQTIVRTPWRRRQKSGSNAAEAIGLPLIECSRWEERSGPPAILTDTDFLKSRAAHGGGERSERRT
jgi:hypothetical protein